MSLNGLLSETPKERKAHGVYGFRPAVELRHGPVPGEIIKVDEQGLVIGHWRVDSNALVAQAMKGEVVIMSPGFPSCAAMLREAGAHVTVHPRDLPAYNLAMTHHGGVTYL